MIASILRDIRFALRWLRRQPGFTATALASIGLGMAAIATVIVVANAVYLRPLPYPDGSRLVMLWQDLRGVDPYWTVTGGNYTQWKGRASSFEAMAAFNIDAAAIEGELGTELVRSSVVTPGFFEALGVVPAVGTSFREVHGTPGNDDVVILSHGLWQQRFGGDPDAVGRSVVIDGRPHTILGVMPADYRHPEAPEFGQPLLWRPLALGEAAHDFYRKFLRVIARLEPGVSVERARREMDALARSLEREVPEFNEGYGVTLVPLRDELLQGLSQREELADAGSTLRLLLGAGGFVLLLVVVNMAGLSVVRCQQRLKEFAVRTACGASASRVARQVLTEALLLAVAGAVLGLSLTGALTGALRTLASERLTAAFGLEIDGTVLLLTLGTAALAGVAFGAAPALLASRPNVRAWLSAGTRGSGGAPGARRLREAFMAIALAVTVVALFSAALMGRSFIRLVSTDPGFESTGLLTLRTTPPEEPYGDPDRALAVHDALKAELRGLPGVVSAAFANDVPFGYYDEYRGVGLPGTPEEEMLSVERRVVSDGYFDLLGIRVLEGSADVEAVGRRATVVVNASLVSRLWPGESPVGKRILVEDRDTFDISVSGLVADVLDDGFDGEREPRIYLPHGLNPGRRMAYVLRTAGDPGAAVPRVRQAVARIDPKIIVSRVHTLGDLMGDTVSGRRALVVLVSAFGILALLLAGIGIYGVASYNVAVRRHELGVRAALGAGRSSLRRLVLEGALRVTAIGLVGGVVVSIPAARLLEATLFEIGPFDPLSYGLVALALGATTLAAAVVPARRATDVDPADALRVY